MDFDPGSSYPDGGLPEPSDAFEHGSAEKENG
jgi:hypothetical protein